MTIVLDGTNGITTPDLESSGQVTGTTASFSGDVTLGSSVLATPTGSAPVYACRAWVNFNGTGTVAIRASGNVTSITDNGVGNYTVNFTTAMPDANYSVSFSGSDGDWGSVITLYPNANPATTSAQVRIANNSASPAAADINYVCLAFFR